jgi:hypothetical protein
VVLEDESLLNDTNNIKIDDCREGRGSNWDLEKSQTTGLLWAETTKNL